MNRFWGAVLIFGCIIAMAWVVVAFKQSHRRRRDRNGEVWDYDGERGVPTELCFRRDVAGALIVTICSAAAATFVIAA